MTITLGGATAALVYSFSRSNQRRGACGALILAAFETRTTGARSLLNVVQLQMGDAVKQCSVVQRNKCALPQEAAGLSSEFGMARIFFASGIFAGCAFHAM